MHLLFMDIHDVLKITSKVMNFKCCGGVVVTMSLNLECHTEKNKRSGDGAKKVKNGALL